ncbi:MAG TPA: glycosyltransferase [Burkholderiales bacterium]|nr:glycosyltransferase [Burkholderiales bacterium]
MTLRVSVVVPTCGRPQLLARCIAALESQSLPEHDYEVIVVEDGGRRGPASARNRGWRLASAPIVAFTDDDCVPDRDWLRNGLAAMESADAVTGRIIMPIPDRPTDYERDAKGLERAEFVTANCFCRKFVLEKLGGFDERFRLAWREDSDLHFRLLEGGYRVRSEGSAVVVHPVRPARWGVSVSQQRKVMFDALLFKKHRELYRRRIRSAPRWDYYAIVLSLMLSVYHPAFLIAWVALTLRFAWQRLRGTSHSLRHIVEMLVTSMLIPPVSVFWRIVGAWRFKVAFA